MRNNEAHIIEVVENFEIKFEIIVHIQIEFFVKNYFIHLKLHNYQNKIINNLNIASKPRDL